MIPFISQFAGPIIYILLFGLLVLCGMGNPLPEDTALIAGGYFAYEGIINMYVTIAVCYVGVLLGDIILYHLGRRYGQRIVTHPRLRRVMPIKRIDLIRRSFKKWGRFTVFFARFLPGLRTPTFLASGVMHLPFRSFLLYDGCGAVLSVPLFVGLGYLFGSNVDVLRRDIKRIEHWAMAVIVVAVALFFLWRWWRSGHVRPEEDEME